jgi:DnaK suppressor protein
MKHPEKFVHAQREVLLQLTRQLNGDIETDAPATGDDADRSCVEIAREISMTVTSNTRETLLEITHALRRIELGNYGVCEASGELIPVLRLEAVPWTRYTIKHQASFEQARRGARQLNVTYGIDRSVDKEDDGDDEPESSAK